MTRLTMSQARQLGILPAKKKRDIPKIIQKAVQWDAKIFPGGIWLQVPEIPPSLNEWKNWHPMKQRKYKRELTTAVSSLKMAFRLPRYERALIQIIYYFPTVRQRDADNYSGKFLLDAIKNGGLIMDDNSGVIDLPEPQLEVDRYRPRVEVFIWERM